MTMQSELASHDLGPLKEAIPFPDDFDDEVLAADSQPMRAELLSVGQLQQHALWLAGWHELAPTVSHPKDTLLARLASNEQMFVRSYALVTDAVARGRRITPAAEWFIDNYPLIEEQIRTARRHLPRGYSRELPRLANATSQGTPRVYDLALELISHSHGRVDEEALRAFVSSYQSTAPLRLGELWAIPIMLRLALLENLRRVVSGVIAGRRERERASYWMKRMLEVAGDHSQDVILVLAEMVKERNGQLTDSFVAELASSLQGQGPALALASAWLEQRLADRGQTIAHVFQLASQSQANDQVAIGNSIGSLRFLGATDWRTFVEAMSVVERTLRLDPAHVYSDMDFATRDRYRHAVEDIARRSARSENDVAQAAIDRALHAAADDARTRHVGYWLVDRGVRHVETDAQARVPLRTRARRLTDGTPLGLYLAAVAIMTASVTALFSFAWFGSDVDMHGAVRIGALLLLTLCASHVAVALAQWFITAFVSPVILPRLDLTRGIPKEHETLVAVPALLTDEEEVDELIERLEVRFMANKDEHLSFALVTDFKDAPEETSAHDDALLRRACDGIAALNARHATPERPFVFSLLHRARRFNAQEGCWMGWERKRGKLEQLNAALRGKTDLFATVVGDLSRLQGVKYVVALDADTELPRDAAQLLVATMAHPLNRPVHDEAAGRVTSGYAILQPRVGVNMTSAARSAFARIFAGEPGIDPYTLAVSDVYQDLFQEGSFVGKGIYDIDAMQRALAGRIPENRVLSHDLLEGAYARCGLVSDVLLIEDFPATHGADVMRRSRWLRGDWQVASWLLPRVPAGVTPRAPNTISALSKWKIFDNLRRSLVPTALTALMIGSWLVPGAAALAPLLVLSVLLFPGLLSAAAAIARSSRELTRRERAPDIARDLLRQLARDVLQVAWLPADAFLCMGSIGRALVRMMITRRRLLEWRTARDAARAAKSSLAGSYAALWTAPATAAVVAVLLVATRAPGALSAAPFLALWTAAPALSWMLGRSIGARALPLDVQERRFLRIVARRTWRFFEVFVGSEDHDLPPDNVQEDPPQGVAHRTSPTNIGLSLLANLSAWDFGYISAARVIERTTRTLDTLERLERHRGHFYNWYDTRSLEPLHPLYVSTVDSGNLAGHLLTLAAGLEELIHAPALRAATFAGLEDALALYAQGNESEPPASLAALLREPARDADTAMDVLRRVIVLAEELPRGRADGDDSDNSDGADEDERSIWVAALVDQAAAALLELGAAARADAAEGAGRAHALRALAVRCRAMAEMDLGFLYDRSRRLLHIGVNVLDHRADASFYDLLASEARLASFVGIAQGQLPQEHWFSLGRALTKAGGGHALLSWSGSMFEYLMPLLVMPTYERTLLHATYLGIVERQIEFGRVQDVAWGVSESGYMKTDAHQNYQYRAFGVPGLGFKRGLAADLVIAPYASAMALMVDPQAACENLQRLEREGVLGAYGFYEAVDFTTARLPPGKTRATVKSWMAHHQGMSLLSIAYALLDQPMQRRFIADASLRATALLLQERVPKVPPIYPHPAEVSPAALAAPDAAASLRVFTTPSTPRPEVHLLSNGQYHVAVTNAGGGYSRHRDLAVTRWREDPTRDCWGTFLYVRDVETGALWSAAHQPTLVRAQHYEAIFTQGRAEFRRVDGDIETHVEISVSPEDDVELRRVTLTNRGRAACTLEVTSYAEVVLAPAAADDAHPAFSNLFVQTELLREQGAVLCTRRPRSGKESPPTLLHLMSVHGAAQGAVSFETSREAFIGRGRDASDPVAMTRELLTDSAGSVLDPIVAIRNRVVVEPHESVQLHIVTGITDTRDKALLSVEKYRGRHAADRVLEMSWTQSQVLMRRLDATDADIQLYERLASKVLYASPAMRAPQSVVARNRRGQSALWSYSISGDLPIVLVRIGELAELPLVRHMLKAHVYWRLKGLSVDLVIWNEDPSGYRQELQEQILALTASLGDASLLDKPGGVFVRRGEQISEEDRVLLQTVARAILHGSAGPLAEQTDKIFRTELPRDLFPGRDRRAAAAQRAQTVAPVAVPPNLAAFNGTGGFTADGREYVILTTPDKPTPAPWVNVLANPWFGTVVSESGGAYSWCENAHGYRLTPWNNDPVSDPSGERFYLRDDEDGRFWSPTPLPAPGAAGYKTRHGFGYSVFEHTSHHIESELTTFVATDAPVKFVVVKLKNKSSRTRRLSLTGTFDLVLGAQRAANVPHVVSHVDVRSGALFAHNAYNAEFAERVAFLDASEERRTVSGDRTEILGRNGSAAEPAFLRRTRLSGRVGACLDPCLAIQCAIELQPGQERELCFTFGSGQNADDARSLVTRFRGVGPAHDALRGVWEYWKRTLGTVHVQTPDVALNFLANGWLMYQVLAARMWARSGFYQSGGAFGFRDQLQDAMSLVHAEPALLRAQILRSASRQFREGDVQHWWHPPLGRGVRTRISDDYLWLPYATCRYVKALGDIGVLSERAPFLDGRAVKMDEDSYYDLPMATEDSAALYEHCCRAIRHGLRFGAHGLPLMGSGDWNDGMNLVGDHGHGESVWLGFFLHDVLHEFEPLARQFGDEAFATLCAAEAATLRDNLEKHGWDGAWYRRAYFDDGTPLGSAQSVECQIDALPQSWSVLTGVGDRARALQGMAAVNERLVRRDLDVIQLFDPPFDGAGLEPGYVRGYVPGVRENGGQYTHAAVWTVMAFAAAGDAERAWELFGLINPVRHGDTASKIARYRVEPYVVAADVYTNPQHAGRGGWTWYTGSAGWMYRLVMESLLGVTLEVDHLRVAPLMPAGWSAFDLHYRYRETIHHIHVKAVPPNDAGARGVQRVIVDGVAQADLRIPLTDDRHEHWVDVEVSA